jgi:hypothetical protein
MRRLIFKPMTSSFLSMAVLILLFTDGCYNEMQQNNFKYADATVDDLMGKKIEAILIGIVDDPDKTHMWAVIGDIDKAQKIIDCTINADIIVDQSWVHKLTCDFIKAERVKINCEDICKVIFLTKERGYVIKMSGNDEIIYGPDYRSEQIRNDLKAMGLEKNYGMVDIKEMVKSRKARTSGIIRTTSGVKYIDATVDDLRGKKIEAILIRIVADPDNTHMAAVIGDINEVQKIVGYEITTDKVVDSSWIQRLTSDLIKAERVKTLTRDDAKMIFLTKEKGYVIKMSGDDKIIYGPDYQSKKILSDFKEMGLEE